MAQFHKGEVAALRSGAHGTFVPTDPGRPSLEVVVVQPVPEADGRFVKARFRAEPADSSLPPGSVGWVELGPCTLDVLVVDQEAILQSPAGPFVLIPSADGRTFDRRSIEVGRVGDGVGVIVSGLAEGERVVAVDAFFVDAEGRTQTARVPPPPSSAP
jgi:multidrug efflux pump subunit AcrA (membrane-fusion protein)